MEEEGEREARNITQHSEHVTTTSKLQKSMADGPQNKLLRIIVTDAHTTDSSSDEEELFVRRLFEAPCQRDHLLLLVRRRSPFAGESSEESAGGLGDDSPPTFDTAEEAAVKTW